MRNFKYIDLFAGIGGFHQAMKNLGGECVFASEIDSFASKTYETNYKIAPHGDITKISEDDIPVHDVLCAGFPCQTFSKAGGQRGMEDTRGTLFFDIARILKKHKTKYIILENVRNLVSHDNGKTWDIITKTLKDLGYRLTSKPILLSPHNLGIPQLRERVVIVGIHDPENTGTPLIMPQLDVYSKKENSIYDILQKQRVKDKYYLSESEVELLKLWDEFYKGIEEEVIGFPVWLDYLKITPNKKYPEWKKNIILKNNRLYKNNKLFIDTWLRKYNNLEGYNSTSRKFEWQAGNSIKSLFDGVIQLRPSGIRVKRPDCFPALVAMVQIPIIGKYKRRLTIREAARLQSFPDSFKPDTDDFQAYKQFGNAVNVKVIEKMAEILFNL